MCSTLRMILCCKLNLAGILLGAYSKKKIESVIKIIGKTLKKISKKV